MTSMGTPRILISVGELSADEHAAALVSCIKKILPHAEFKAMGGRHLRNAGVETVVDSERSASVMGFAELLGSLGKIVGAYRKMARTISQWRPHLVIVLDYPDFNFRVVRAAHRAGAKVLYFIPPQVWAWRSGRTRFLQRYTDAVATIFPFEKRFLTDHGLTHAHFVGHPLVDRPESQPIDDETRRSLKRSFELDPMRQVLAVFPGSRRFEVQRHLRVMSEGLQLLHTKFPSIQFVVNVAPSLDERWVRSLLPESSPLVIKKEDSLSLLKAADFALLKSGTSNLQAVMCEVPFVMFYIASPLSAWIVKRAVHLKQYSIVNILSPNTVEELVQERATPERIAAALDPLLSNDTDRAAMIEHFREIKALFASPDKLPGSTPYERVAHLAVDLLG